MKNVKYSELDSILVENPIIQYSKYQNIWALLARLTGFLRNNLVLENSTGGSERGVPDPIRVLF